MQDKELPIEERIKKAIETYNKYSSIYSEYTKNKLLQFQLVKFISMLPEKGKILDAGSGSGRDAAYLQEDGFEVTAVDISDGMIKEAKNNGVKAIKGDLLNMISNQEFVGIWCMATLADIPKSQSKKLLQNFHKALKQEGILYIAVKEGEGEQIIKKERYENSPRFYAFYKKEELENILKENKFEIIESSVSNDEETNWVEIFAKKN